MTAPVDLTIVVPCYNEEAVLADSNRALLGLLDRLSAAGRVTADSRLLYVDDGSRDRSWKLIEDFARADSRVEGLKLSRNRGHQNALLAGLFGARGEAVVSIDADLQDDIEAIGDMLEAYRQGSDIVYGVRDDRSADSFFKRFSAEAFYRLLRLCGVESVFNHADYRLLSRRAVEALKEYREVNIFLRGMVPLVGFRHTAVSYSRRSRQAGESKYPLRKMLALAWEGITSLSVAPLRFVTFTGAIVFVFSMLVSVGVVFIRLFTDRALPGWTSTVLPIFFLGGIQILCIGILGEYLGKIYKEVKARPRFIVERHCRFSENGEPAAAEESAAGKVSEE